MRRNTNYSYVTDLFDVLDFDLSPENLNRASSITLANWADQTRKQLIADLLIIDRHSNEESCQYVGRAEQLFKNLALIMEEQYIRRSSERR